MAAKYYHYWNDSLDSLILKIRSVSSSGIGGTVHSMPVPLLLAVFGYQAADTVWIDSLSLTKKYSLPDTLNFTIQFDPGNKILKTAFTFSDHPELLKVVTQPDSGNIRVEWEPFFDFSGYQLFIWRKEVSGSFVLLDSLNIQGYRVSVIPPATGTYRVAVRAINGNHLTALSDFREVNFSNFPMNKGILLVDETRNGNGSHTLLPTDAAVDSFYRELLSGYTFTQFDVFQAGNLPNLLDFGEYSLIIWHHEVNYQTGVSEIQSDLAVYLEAGGKVIFSGMNYLNNFSADFLETYLGIEQYDINSAADFTGAAGMAGFPDLTVDTSKITFPLYNHKLPNVMIFDTTSAAENIAAYISGSLNPLYHLQPAAVRVPSRKDSSVIGTTTLGFPLYFMEPDSARTFVMKALTDLGIMVGIDHRSFLPVNNFRLYSNYPNPFNPVTKILFELNKSTGIDIFIYNLLGEVVRRLYQGNLAVGRHEIEWDGRNDSGVVQASGVYFAKLTAGRQTQAIKIILQR